VFVLDTHVAVWTVTASAQLSPQARRAIEDTRSQSGGLFISDVSFYEIASMIARNRIELDIALDSFLEEVESRFSALPITRQIAARSVQFPSTFPKDPVDRIIGATALVEGLPLITADQGIQRSNALKTIW
jgi:PIN domain nuclease of toxin-antitoxin system